MRRFIATVGALLPVALACNNADTHPCPGYYHNNLAEVSDFCATFTQSTVAASTGLPSWATVCDNSPKKLSSACSCQVPATAVAASAPSSGVVASTTPSSSGFVTSVKNVESSPVFAITRTHSSSVTGAAAKVAVSSEVVVSSSVAATPAATPAVTSSAAAVPTISGGASVSLTSGGVTCTVTEYAGISSAVASCTNIVLSNIKAPASSTIDLTSLQTGTHVIFAGKTTFEDTNDKKFDPIVITGTDIIVEGADGHVIDGNGQSYWDGKGSNGGDAKPNHFIVAKHVNNGRFENLNIQNWPVHCFYVSYCNAVTFSNILLNNTIGYEPNSKSGSKAAAHNSDGFDISSSDNIVLTDSHVYNQDDCVAVTSGSKILVDSMYCSGGHGLSIGSIGGKSNNTVSDVTFQNSVIVDSQNGCRIKSNEGETGEVSNIHYKNITMENIEKYGLVIQQDYLNGGPTGEPSNGVTISGVTVTDVKGTMSSSKGIDYYVLCGDGSCSDFSYSGVEITGGSGDKCNYPSSGCPAI
ncbi:endo-polygalacturonase D [Aureobasidium pullulans]|uniref:endo-polygalacturonase n=1 Tax=Aureobasidium pullulans TaxID=5580 RepID=A0A4S9XPK8_AURPU|nr:endo-polygalacturonase D [Aureobasidium pullulans]